MEEFSCEARICNIDGARTKILHIEVSADYNFFPGQYLSVIHPNGLHIPLSLASSPHQLPSIHLHYRSTPNSPEAHAMDELLEIGKPLRITAASGDVRAGPLSEPLLVIAAGTAAAQAFSCFAFRQQEAATGSNTLLWCADYVDDIYRVDTLTSYAHTTVVTKVDKCRTPQNTGMKWLRENASKHLAAYIILAGSPEFVYATTDLLVFLGIKNKQLHADVYSYASRKT